MGLVIFVVIFYILMGVGALILGFIIWDKGWGIK